MAPQRLLTIARHLNQTVNIQRLLSSSVQLKISKSLVLIDEKVQITVNGLASRQKVTLLAYMTEGDKLFGSCGHFVADESGSVDNFKQISYGGTFQGIEPMGLFWSMRTTPGVKPGRLLKTDVMSPYKVNLAVHDGFQEFDSLPWSESPTGLASCQLQRYYAAPGVQRFPLQENGLHGTLVTPPGEGPFPAIIDIFGLGGGILEFRSALLASHGFASFVVGYVGLPELPKNEMEIDFNYFLKAFDWLASHPKVDSNNIGGIGSCVGGGYLQFLTSRRPVIKCIATINTTTHPIGKDQVVEGEPVVPGKFRFDRVTIIDNLISFKNMIQGHEDIPMCPSWQHGAKMLFLQGLDDRCVNPIVMEIFKKRIPDKFKDNCTFISYPGTGHLLEPPYAPRCGTSFNKIFKMNMLWGGNDIEHTKAQEDSWPKILQFFYYNLKNV